MEYTIKWENQGGIRESGMTKWVITLRANDETLVKKIENNEVANLQNFSEVNIKLSLTYDEATKQTTTNTLKVFFDSESDDTELLEMTVLFDRTRLSLNIEDIKESDFVIPRIEVGDIFTCKSNEPIDGENNYKFRLETDSTLKWLKDTELDTTFHSQDCSKFDYTGIAHKYEGTINSRCGPNHGHKKCPGAMCCSKDGWCGGQVGVNSTWCHEYRWNKDMTRSNLMLVKDTILPAGDWRPRWGGHYEDYDGTNVTTDYTMIIPYWNGSKWIVQHAKKLEKGDLVRCRINDPLKQELNAVYYYDGNNTIKNVTSVDDVRKITNKPGMNMDQAGAMVIHNCTGVHYGGVWQG